MPQYLPMISRGAGSSISEPSDRNTEQQIPFFLQKNTKLRHGAHCSPLSSISQCLCVVPRKSHLVLVGLVFLALFFYLQVVRLPDELVTSQSSIIGVPSDSVDDLSSSNRQQRESHAIPESNAADDGNYHLSANRLDAIGSKRKKPHSLNFAGPVNERQTAVRDAMRHAWSAYRKHAWGHDHLRPVSRNYHDWFGLGLTIVDSLDTLLLMGMKEEFDEGRSWVSEELRFDNNRFVNLFETTIRVLGGLLSAYHLTGDTDRMFLDKAEQLGHRLIGALTQSSSPVPFTDVHLASGNGQQTAWGGLSSLSEATSIQLEFRDLSRALANGSYEKAAFRVSEHIHSMGCNEHDGLCPMFLSPRDGSFQTPTTITMGARADSYYEYLLKQWLQLGGRSRHDADWLRSDYARSMAAVRERLWRRSQPSGFGFVGELLPGGVDESFQFSPKMDHLVCFLAGTLALGAHNGLPAWHMDVAKDLGQTCFEMYNVTMTGLGPEIAHFNIEAETSAPRDINIRSLDTHSLLRPEAVEAWFYLYRLTGDRKYQDWGWRVFQAIERHARVPSGGYASVHNVRQIPVVHRDLMESFFLSETLKYLYMLFEDDRQNGLISLDEWVFNTEGHPLPILFQ